MIEIRSCFLCISALFSFFHVVWVCGVGRWWVVFFVTTLSPHTTFELCWGWGKGCAELVPNLIWHSVGFEDPWFIQLKLTLDKPHFHIHRETTTTGPVHKYIWEMSSKPRIATNLNRRLPRSKCIKGWSYREVTPVNMFSICMKEIFLDILFLKELF